MKKYHTPNRILLKLSGEALQWKQWYGIDPEFLAYIAEKIVHIVKVQKIEVAIVVGGGNMFRGVELERGGFDRATGDNMGTVSYTHLDVYKRQAKTILATLHSR